MRAERQAFPRDTNRRAGKLLVLRYAGILSEILGQFLAQLQSRVGWLTIEWPAISRFDMAGLFILYLNRNIPQFLIGIGGTLRGH